MRSSILVSGLIIAAATLTSRAARAGDQEYPVSFVERPMTLPKMTLAPSLELDINRIGISVDTGFGTVSSSTVVAGMQIGASFGILDNLEVGAIVLPIQFNNGAGYGGLFVGEEGELAQPSIYGTFRFLHREQFDLGVRLGITFVVPNSSVGTGAGAVIAPSVPFLLHIGKLARLDAAVGVKLTVASVSVSTPFGNSASSTQTAGGMDVPISVAFDIIEPLHLGVSTGVHVDDFSDGGHTTRIPIGIFGGYAIGEKRPLIDIDGFFSFFDFLTPGGGLVGNTANPGIFVVGVNARGYFYF